ncbi:MAG: 2-dehydropantoate 2-reductase [Pseudomonadota bacterium]
MEIVVVGPGALGCLLAATLTESGEKVLLLDHRSRRAEFIIQHGLTVEREGRQRRVRVRVSSRPEDAGAADLVLICVKAYQTAGAIGPLIPHLNPDARVMTLQNGLGNLEILAAAWGPERVWGGVTSQGATLQGLGQIIHGGAGETVFGAWAGPGPESLLDAAVRAFQKAGLPARMEPDVKALIWSKLIVNVGINPLTALTRLRNGQLLDHPWSLGVMAAAVDEAALVARAHGIGLLYPDPLERVKAVASATATNISSMLQDVLAKRRTEIEQINGAVAAKGRDLGLPTPINQTLADLVKTVESSYGIAVQ